MAATTQQPPPIDTDVAPRPSTAKSSASHLSLFTRFTSKIFNKAEDSPESSSSELPRSSVSSRARTASTAATSSHTSTPISPWAQDPDEWFERFRSNPNLTLHISDSRPSNTDLDALRSIKLYNHNGDFRTFGSLIDPSTAVKPRQLFVFVRHFYCGACQAYLKALTQSLAKDYFTMTQPTHIVVIGCGEFNLIEHYRQFTDCPFNMFVDPSRELFKKLGMITTLDTGKIQPEYMEGISKGKWLAGQFTTIGKSLNDPNGIRLRDVVRGGNMMQTGGEFLFEEGQVMWCHRMSNYRDHTEVRDIRKLLEIDD